MILDIKNIHGIVPGNQGETFDEEKYQKIFTDLQNAIQAAKDAVDSGLLKAIHLDYDFLSDRRMRNPLADYKAALVHLELDINMISCLYCTDQPEAIKDFYLFTPNVKDSLEALDYLTLLLFSMDTSLSQSGSRIPLCDPQKEKP